MSRKKAESRECNPGAPHHRGNCQTERGGENEGFPDSVQDEETAKRQDWMIIMHKISSGKVHHVGALFTLSDLIQQKGFHLLFWANIKSSCASRMSENNAKENNLVRTAASAEYLNE